MAEPVRERWYTDGHRLYSSSGDEYSAVERRFVPTGRETESSWTAMDARQTVAWLQSSTERIRTPVAVVGPREANEWQRAAAYQVGGDLAAVGLTVVCGGRQGVMEEVCRGVRDSGGLSIGLLPDTDCESANPYVTVPIATGIGIARNALIARSAHLMLAIGGGLGTISEIALGLQFGKRVFALDERRLVDGVELFSSWEKMAPYFFAAVLNPERTPL